MTSRRTADWTAIRTIYEQGRLSTRELARQYAPLTEGAVRKRAKKEGWMRPGGARVVRPAPIVRRAEHPLREPRRDREPAKRRLIIERRDPTKPSARSPEDVVELGELVLFELSDLYKTVIKHRELLDEMFEHCAEDYHVPRYVYLRLSKQFGLLALSRQLRNLAETYKIFVSTRQMLAALSHQKK
jgi:hypothetical protein